MFLRCLFYCFFSLSLLGVVGCFRVTAPESEQVKLKDPIVLKLEQGYVSEDVLHLRVEVESLASLPVDSVFVQLSSLKNGLVQETQTLPLKTVYKEPELQAGTRLLLPFTLSIQNVDRFTLSCFYGEAGYDLSRSLNFDEVREEPKSGSPPVAPLEIFDLSIKEEKLGCEAGVCNVFVHLSGRLRKSVASDHISSVRLAYRMVWVPDGHVPEVLFGQSDKLEQDEKLLPFGEEEVPTEGFSFEVKGTNPLPILPGGRFMPVTRILSFKRR